MSLGSLTAGPFTLLGMGFIVVQLGLTASTVYSYSLLSPMSSQLQDNACHGLSLLLAVSPSLFGTLSGFLAELEGLGFDSFSSSDCPASGKYQL